MISSLIMSELFPACFSGNNNFNLSQSSLRLEYKNIVFETPESETIKSGDLSNFISVQSRVDFVKLLYQNSFPLQNHTLIFYPVN